MTVAAIIVGIIVVAWAVFALTALVSYVDRVAGALERLATVEERDREERDRLNDRVRDDLTGGGLR